MYRIAEFSSVNCNGTDQLGDLGADGKTILK
jgi:hypothetical protein